MPDSPVDRLDHTQLEWGHAMGLSIEDTLAAFAHSGEIMAFQGRHSDDDRFGAVWVSYDDGYQVHVRYLDASFEDQVLSLEKELGRPIARTTGGASFRSLSAARNAVEDAAVPASVTFNPQTGTVDIDERWSGEAPGVDPSVIRHVPPTPPPFRRIS